MLYRRWASSVAERVYLALVALLGLCGAVAVGNYAVTVGSGTNFGSVVVGGVHYAQQFICDLTTPAQCAAVSAGGAVSVAGTVTAAQATAANLNATVVQATGTNLHTVVDSGTITTVSTVTNLAQMNGAALLMGNGATGTGAQRVTIANDNTLPTGWASSVAIASTTSGQTGPLVQCAVTTGAPTYTTAQTDPLSCDTAGGLRVNPGTVTVTATNLSTNVAQINGVTPLMGNGVTGTGSARVTIASDNTAFAVNSTLSAETTKVIGTVRNLGNAGGVFDAVAGAAVPANSLQVGMAQGGNLVTMTGTSGNLNVQCANCSGSGVSTADEAAFTAGSSLFAGTGGFFQTTATNNALTNGQQGMWQMTANRAGFVNLRNAAGTEIGVTGTELFVGGRGTAGTATGGVLTVQGVASMTKLLVTPDSVALPANQSVNVSQINGVTPLMGQGATGTGSHRITIANDNTLPTGWASSVAIASTTSGQTGPLAQCAVTTASPTYTTAQTDPLSCDTAGSLRVAIVSGGGSGGTASTYGAAFPATGTAAGFTDGTNMVSGRVGDVNNVAAATNYLDVLGIGRYNATQPTLTDTRFNALQLSSRGELLVAPGVSTFPVTATNLSTNIAQINGVTPLMGNGATGTGSHRVTIANDNTLPTGWASSVAIASTTSGQTGPLVQCAVTTAAPTYTTAQTDPLSCDTAGSLRTTVVNANANGQATMANSSPVVIASNQSAVPVTLTSTTLTGTSAVNVSQINGVTPLMGNGVTGTGSQRVTLASDGTAISTAGYMSVKIDQTTVGTTNAVSLAQIGATTVLGGNGASGAGAQRVSISNDSSAIANWGHVATGAAPPTGSTYISANTSGATGGLVQGLIQCDSKAIYDASTNGSTELVALTSGRTIHVCGYSIMAGGTVNVKLIYGTGTACATGSNNMTPAWQLTAQVGLVDGSPFARGLKTASANALCINTSAGVAAQAIVYYAVI